MISLQSQVRAIDVRNLSSSDWKDERSNFTLAYPESDDRRTGHQTKTKLHSFRLTEEEWYPTVTAPHGRTLVDV